ncbi:hypothetical protein FC26_GL001035 [Paucilactobacillus vaccinostercus DSM 20634]|uniref:Uncharacterized protein n=1 Tax=Paucilactobacillus vaccinostercus DSM 20634 TaxID=1423813 RepID=A0A0R2A5Z2_9LACO|nr:hypothetical protein FC26_GL001035 [Paucilactobacillus vaccinostercus DSM 20634]
MLQSVASSFFSLIKQNNSNINNILPIHPNQIQYNNNNRFSYSGKISISYRCFTVFGAIFGGLPNPN